MFEKPVLPYLVLVVTVACSEPDQGSPCSGCGASGAGGPNGGGSGVAGSGGNSAGSAPLAGAGNGGQAVGGAAGSSPAGAAGSGGAASGSAGVSSGGVAGTLGSAGAGMGGAAGNAGDLGTSGGGASAGAAGSLAGGGAGGSAGGGANVVVSDDFEAPTLDAGKWQMGITGQGSIAVTTEEKHGGNQAVKVVGMSGPVMFVNTSAFPLPNGVIHFRVWMRFTSADWANHVAFVAASPGAESQEVRFGGQNNAYHANLAADGDGLSPDPFEYPECPLCVAPVANQWACLRGKLDFANSDAELYVNETLAVDARDADDWHSGTGTLPQSPTQIGFGWAIYGGAMNTVYYDDLAIAYEPIPCE